MKTTPIRRAIAVACLLACLPLAAASFHLVLRRADPGIGATVTAAPSQLRLWFSQRPELRVTRVRLVNSSGAAVGTGAWARSDSAGAPIVVPITGPVPAGAYRVEWRTMARDGHVQSGSYRFTLAPARSPR